MKTIFKIISITVLVIISSCSDKQSEQSKAFDDKMKETVKIHDDIMPKMSEINSMISRLEDKKEKLEQAEEVNANEVQLYDRTIENLKDAHDLMMLWMKEFSFTFSRTEINEGLATKDKDSINAKLKNLDSHYKSAEEMREAVSKSIENAQTLLAE